MRAVSRGLATLAVLLTCAAVAPATDGAPVPIAAALPAPQQHALTHDDLEAYFDGFFPDALARADIAGAVIVVVKDGHVLLEKGYGFSDATTRVSVDPARTLFRPGSISKLFTWTSVMQLVEAGKIDLDRDVNDYLDFRIPAAFPKPITLRNLMTHTAGFEEHIKGLMIDDPKRMTDLRTTLITSLPRRIYPPGEVAAYSNYGASLAGYIVQRVSGEKFEDYVAAHIFKPLHMNHSTFVQPLPRALQPDMSKGYARTGQKPQAFELIDMSPAGALSASGDDMAQFMMAHLNDGSFGGAEILKPETAKLMHAPAFQPTPPLPSMALGFYHEDRNGHTIVGHGGDTQVFHSDLHLILDRKVGVFVSLNGVGNNEGPVTNTRALLFDGFMDRYFPGTAVPAAKQIPNAAKDAALVAGTYITSRRSDSTFMRLATLVGALTLAANPDGSLTMPEAAAAGIRAPKKWIEIAPFIWRDEHGPHRLVAKVTDGKLKWISMDLIPPILVFQQVPFLLSPSFQLPLLLGTMLMLALTVLFWPVKAILRWRYGRPFDLAGRDAMLYRAARLIALIDLLLFAGWSAFLLLAQAHLDVFDSQNDYLIRIFEVLAALGVIGVVAPLAQFFINFGNASRPWWTKITDAGLALAAVSTVWFVFAYRLITLSLNY